MLRHHVIVRAFSPRVNCFIDDFTVQQQPREGPLVERKQALHGLAQVHQDLVRPLARCIQLRRGIVRVAAVDAVSRAKNMCKLLQFDSEGRVMCRTTTQGSLVASVKLSGWSWMWVRRAIDNTVSRQHNGAITHEVLP
jgi:hypothetical protein